MKKRKFNPSEKANRKKKYNNSNFSEKEKPYDSNEEPSLFSDLLISPYTLEGLKKCNFTKMTDIQRAAIPCAFDGHDILGAARTGSGKTLAFLIPIIENLFRMKWEPIHGLGALILCPARELALQIYSVLQLLLKNARKHNFTVMSLIGGKDIEKEQKQLATNLVSILIATPGRLLQHLEQTPNFTLDNIQICVFDEADRILDMGFYNILQSIIQYLPLNRQTLLFSATQTKSITQLARLSLNNPKYISVHEDPTISVTPPTLKQYYMICEAHEKYNIFFSFLKTHAGSKIIVFLSSCKQVRFLYEVYRLMGCGFLMMHVHGRMKQSKRIAVTQQFSNSKSSVLFSTDLVARGLDFPSVDWILHFDCPEDVDQYIHRSGRTARMTASGSSLLLLLPSEQHMLHLLSLRRIEFKHVKSNPKYNRSVNTLFASFTNKNSSLKYLATRAYVSYMRSIHLQPNKDIFKVSEINGQKLAEFMGVNPVPKLKFVPSFKNTSFQLKNLLEKKKQNRDVINIDEDENIKIDLNE